LVIPEEFGTYSFEHLDLFYEENFQPLLCSSLDEGKDMIFLEKDTCDEAFQPPYFPLSRYVTKDVTGKHVPCPNMFLRKKHFLEFKGRLNALRRSLISQSFNLPLSNYQSSSRFLFIPFQTSGSDKIQASQSFDPLSQPDESLPCHNPIQRWIDHSCENMAWHNFVPPSHLHELDFMISYDIMTTLTHVLFVLDLFLLWFMMKHTGRCCDTILEWFY
jgi:hypothetical protein